MHLGKPPSPPEEKNRIRAETFIFKTEHKPNRKELVWFNSNQYLGRQFLSSDAIRAGYELDDDRPLPGESLIDFTERKLFDSDPDRLIYQAEARLLHALAKFPQARTAMRTAHLSLTSGPAHVQWTSRDREWLFGCLTGLPAEEPVLPAELLEGGTASQLRSYLAGREDCPKYAFCSRDSVEHKASCDRTLDGDVIETTIESGNCSGDDSNISAEEGQGNNNKVDARDGKSNSLPIDVFVDSTLDVEAENEIKAASNIDQHISGTLDEYFLDQPDMFPSFTKNEISQETRHELTVQETMATILRANAMKQFTRAKSKLATVVSEIEHRSNIDEDNQMLADNELQELSFEELQELFLKTGSDVTEYQQKIYELDRSTDRINSHLLDYSSVTGVQYKQSQAELERLDKVMEDHIASLPEDSHRPETSGSDCSYVFGSDRFGDGVIDPTFGGRDPNEYVVRSLPNGESIFE